MTFPLETTRLILRYFKQTDLKPFVAYRNDKEVAKFQAWKFPYPEEDATQFIKGMADDLHFPGSWHQFALELKATGEMIGDVAMRESTDYHRQHHIGYTLARSHWGKGYATEAVTRLLDYLFFELSAHRIVADCDTDNISSFRLLERLGFRREAHFVESYWMGDYWGDEYYYGLLEREWKGKR